MATNTMHRVAPQLVDELSIPFLHIVDTAVDAIRADGVETVGVLGTKAVMEGAFYHERFGSRGVETVVPGIDDREVVDRIIFEELTTGQVREESRGRYLDVIDGLVEKGTQRIVLGCTEIELLVEQRTAPKPRCSIRLYFTSSVPSSGVFAPSSTIEAPGHASQSKDVVHVYRWPRHS